MNEERDREKMTSGKGSNNKEEKALLRKEIDEFESGFPDGVYAVPSQDNRILNTRAFIAYCRENDLVVETVGKDIIEMFMSVRNDVKREGN